MKKNIATLCVLLFLTAGFAQTADEVIQKLYTASGGWDKWAAVKSLRFTGNYLMGPGALAPVLNLITSSPCNCCRDEFTWSGMTSVSVYQKDSGWSYNPFGGKRTSDPMNEESLRSYSLSSDPQGLLFNYKAKGYTVDYLGTDDFEGVDVYRLRLMTKNGDMLYYDIDVETNFLLRTITKIKMPDKETRTEVVYSNYQKTTYGIYLPMTVEFRNEDGSSQGITKYDTALVNGEIKSDEFTRKM